MIDINDITVRIGSKVLLDHASAHIADGWKVGLVGANGCGKSTLFRVLQGGLETESGDVFFPSGYKVVFVEQELQGLEMSILEFILAQDKERAELMSRLENASELELAEIHERLNMIGAASAEARASVILHGLGFAPEDLSRKVGEFSGGWRMRLALAAALFQPSDVLLLDEPTNHLDLEASVWLESHLQKYRGTLLLISHDRNILNALCSHIVHFDHLRLETYSGNYDTFSRTRPRVANCWPNNTKNRKCSGGICNPLLTVSAIRPAKPNRRRAGLRCLKKWKFFRRWKMMLSRVLSFPTRCRCRLR